MKLLVITQKVDVTDSKLGFFYTWLQKIATRVDFLYVICLEKGTVNLPNNVKVLSLGKENKISRLGYLKNFYKYIWMYRHDYDAVFVHMNPEYVCLAGFFWRLCRKKIMLWYTHKSVNLRLRFAELFVTKIFTASVESFRLKSKKVEIVGHGINVESLSLQSHETLKFKGFVSILSAGRITETKDFKTAIDAIRILKKSDMYPSVHYDIAGDPVYRADYGYKKELLQLIEKWKLQSTVRFLGAINYGFMRREYQKHHLFLHMSQTGSMDKVVLEALAAGRPVITSSTVYGEAEKVGVVFSFKQGDSMDLARMIEKVYKSGIVDPEKLPNKQAIDYVKKNHNLDNLIAKIIEYFKV